VSRAFTRAERNSLAGDHSRRLNLSSISTTCWASTPCARASSRWRLVRSDASSNYLGTYTFDSLQAFQANQPSNYTRRIGDPNIAYQNLQSGFYCRTIFGFGELTVSPGVRYEVQTHVTTTATWDPVSA